MALESKFSIPPKKTLPEMEEDVIKFWKENDTFKKSVEQRPENNRFVFIDGPPFVSGSPHYAHLLISIAKDLIPRYWTMKGKKVRRVFGWDCHGLPIEAKVNEKYNIRNRKQVAEFGVDKYVALCREYVEQQISDWRWYIEKIGRWADLDNAYKTMDPDFGESVVWAFKQMYDKGYVYRGKRTSLYSTETSTPVSDFEVAMDPDNYRDVEDLSVYIKFEIKEDENPWKNLTGENKVYLLAWTTTPWTLPSNFCLAVNPEFKYVLIKTGNEFYVTGQDRLREVLGDLEFEIIEEFSGEKLLGLSYVPLFDFLAHGNENDYKVYESSDVTNTEGTQILHVAPAFGEVDFELGKKYGVSDLADIDDEGIMTVGEWKGIYIRKASPLIAEDLKQRNLLLRSELYKHRLPFYRSKEPLIYKTQDAYFIKLKELNQEILKLNEEVNWIPESIKEGRFKEVVESAPDWGISRKRYWGTVMPIWACDDGEEIVVGSVEELRKYTDQIAEDEKVSWHRDVLDKIELKKDGKIFRRIPDILDVWLDSGSVPFAEYHYPFENKELFEKGFPADFIIEYTGQIRAWFQILFRVSAALFGRAPFKNVVAHGVLAGTDGRKMSKSFKNYPDSKNILNTIGADALRLYFMSSPLMSGDNTSFNEKELQNKARGVLSIYWNSLVYFLTHAVDRDFDANIVSKNPLDKWIKARLAETIQTLEAQFQGYMIPPAVRAAESFVTDLSTWYIRRSRNRIVAGDPEALGTLYQVLLESAKAFAPIIPFITENIYKELKNGGKGEFKESIHLEDYPVVSELTKEEQALLNEMTIVRDIASIAHAIRKETNMALKQPLPTLAILGPVKLSESAAEILRDEVNVKKVVFAGEKDEKLKWVQVKEIQIGLDTEIPEELKQEGLVRELTRLVQDLRKRSGLTINDQIELSVKSEDAAVNSVLEKFRDIIESETRSKLLPQVESPDKTEEGKLNKNKVVLEIKKVETPSS